jgi:hypothetical protein
MRSDPTREELGSESGHHEQKSSKGTKKTLSRSCDTKSKEGKMNNTHEIQKLIFVLQSKHDSHPKHRGHRSPSLI